MGFTALSYSIAIRPARLRLLLDPLLPFVRCLQVLRGLFLRALKLAQTARDRGGVFLILGLTGMALVTILVVTSVASLICGYGLLKRRRWARIFGIVLAAVELINFPIGTALGAYALWVLFNKETEAMFGVST